MSFLLEKSKENILAAELIYTTTSQKPLVHCVYFATLQNIGHYLESKFSLTYESIVNTYFPNAERKPGHHQALRYAFNEKLKLVPDRQLRKRVMKDFGVLKAMREEVDYFNSEMDADIPGIALRTANELIKEIENIYNGK